MGYTGSFKVLLAISGPLNMSVNMTESILGLTDNDIKDIAKSLGLSDQDPTILSTLSANLTPEQWENMDNIRKAVAYVGFDARIVVKQFLTKAKENPKLESDNLIEYGNVKVYEKNDAKTDLAFFLKVFLEKGNNLQKALYRCDETIGAVLRRKASAYGISMEKAGARNQLGTKTLTLSRIAKAFCHCTAFMIMKHNIKSKLNSRLFPGLPVIMGHTVFPALIPQDETDYANALRGVTQLVNVEISYMLADPKAKRRMAVRSLGELLEESQKYVDAAIEGSLLTTQARLRILAKAKLIVFETGKEARILVSDELRTLYARVLLINTYLNMTLSQVAAQLDPTEGTSGSSLGAIGQTILNIAPNLHSGNPSQMAMTQVEATTSESPSSIDFVLPESPSVETARPEFPEEETITDVEAGPSRVQSDGLMNI